MSHAGSILTLYSVIMWACFQLLGSRNKPEELFKWEKIIGKKRVCVIMFFWHLPETPNSIYHSTSNTLSLMDHKILEIKKSVLQTGPPFLISLKVALLRVHLKNRQQQSTQRWYMLLSNPKCLTRHNVSFLLVERGDPRYRLK